MSLWSVDVIQYLDKWLYRRFILLLLAAYVLAGLIPSPGLWLQKVEWGSLPGTHRNVTSRLVMLGALLFNAGFSVTSDHVNAFRRKRDNPMDDLDEMDKCLEFAFIKSHERSIFPSSMRTVFSFFSRVQPFAGRTDML